MGGRQSYKICKTCKEEKPIDEFYRKSKSNSYSRYTSCKKCWNSKYNTAPEVKAHRKQWRQDILKEAEEGTERGMKFFKTRLWNSAKARAKDQNVEFTICKEDIVIPEVCPILKIPIGMQSGHIKSNSATLDRINPEKGYVPGNIQVISAKANVIKNNATLEEITRVYEWCKANYTGSYTP